ncbi:MarR family winged helix-turn-helix transcriptional regulator [Nocardia sp. NPDC020380]|uniref:MarR family winged helix-turn-helix transcriptional regulator n=1 Tax=Nocardia sp. NPDC020380 TaxID=3364309 RepID=UPI0037ADB2FC
MTTSPGTPAPSALQAAQGLRVLTSRLRRRFQEASDNKELTPSQLSTMSRLKQGDATASELAAAERVRPQAVATHLADLTERGFVERRPDPDDGRRQIVSLTAAGRDYMTGRRAAGNEWLARTLAEKYTEDERQTVLAALALLERLGQE